MAQSKKITTPRPQINYPLLIGLILVYLAVVILIFARSYSRTQQQIIENIDTRLRIGAMTVNTIIPRDYHDRAIDSLSIPTVEYDSIMNELSDFTDSAGYLYAYSCIQIGKDIYLTTNNASQEERRNKSQVPYFTKWEETNPALYKAFETENMTFVEASDEWGHVRSAYLPRRSPNGRLYICGIDYDVAYVSSLVRQEMIQSGLNFTISLLAALPVFLFFLFSNYTQLNLLRESDNRFRVFMDRIPGLAYLKNNTGQVLYANKGFHTYLDMDPEEMINRHNHELFPQEFAEKITEDDNRIFRDGTGKEIEEFFGERFWSTHKFIIERPETSPLLGGLTLDISKRKKTELALQKALDSLHESQAVADIGTWEISHDLHTIIWSPQVFRIFGLDPAGPAPSIEEFFSFVHPDDIAFVQKKAQEHFTSGGTVISYEYRIIRPDSQIRTIEHMGRVKCNDVGEPIAAFGTIRDVTTHREMDTSLAAERERLVVTLRSIGDGVITTDTEGTVLLINNKASAMTGWSEEEAVGKKLTDIFPIIHEISREPIENPVEQVLTTGGGVELANHTVLVARDGTQRIIADSAAPIKSNQDETIGVVLVFRDITEKKRIEEAMQRTAKLDALAVLAGGIAHDFNNLLGAIYGNIDLAFDSIDNSEAKDFLKTSLNTIERARGLTMQLLTFSKGGKPVKEVRSLFPFIKDTTQFALSGSTITCQFVVDDNIWPCSVDKNQIGQVIDNIIINAVQAMPLGGTITLTAENVTIAKGSRTALQPGDYVRLSIEDEGVGIPPTLLERIFDPFFTTKSKGHGLGLATCYSIISQHEGHIEVQSEQSKGSTFTIYLPATPKQTEIKAERPMVTHQGNGIVIVMDDEEMIRKTILRMLKPLGYTILSCADGKEALSLFREKTLRGENIAALIFDLTIPGGMGGIDTIQEVRKTDTDIPVIVMSGYSDNPVMANPGPYGFTASLHKPFRKFELIELLQKHLPSSSQ